MIRIPGIIPISIHPLFWLLAGLIGWLNSGSLIGMMIWIGIIFFSVLIHEFGHALTALAFGKKPKIDLVALGGLTTYPANNLSFGKQFLIVFNGPFFGFLLFGLASLLLMLSIKNPFWISLLTTVQVVNLFWSIANLVPVIPLDGGHLLRIALEAFFGLKGIKLSFIVGAGAAIVIALFFFLMHGFLLGAIFFLFAFQSYDTWRKAKNLSTPDCSDENRGKMFHAEKALSSGRKDEAKRLFQEILQKDKEGIIFNNATQYLALLLFEEGKRREAYELLIQVKKQLAEEAVCILHELAFDEKDFRLVADLSTTAYHLAPTQETALRNARSFAFLEEAKSAGGWLQTAWNLGNLEVEKILEESIFDSVRKKPDFVDFVVKIKHK